MTGSYELPRTELLAKLAASTAPYVVIAAPNGWGKTVLARQYAAASPHIYVLCTPRHASVAQLLRDLVSGLRAVTTIDENEPIETVAAFLALLPEGIPIFIDGVQLLSESSLRVVRELAYSLFVNRLILLTHYRSNLRWTPLDADTFYLEYQDLAFSDSELQTLARELGVRVNLTKLNFLQGWPLMISLALRTKLTWSSSEQLLEDFLAQLPRELLEVLYPLSLLDVWRSDSPQKFGLSSLIAVDGAEPRGFIELCYHYRLPLFEIAIGVFMPHTVLLEALLPVFRRRDQAEVLKIEAVAIDVLGAEGKVFEMLPLLLRAGRVVDAVYTVYRLVREFDHQGDYDAIERVISQLGLGALRERTRATLPLSELDEFDGSCFRLQANLINSLTLSFQLTQAQREFEELQRMPVSMSEKHRPYSEISLKVLPLVFDSCLPITREAYRVDLESTIASLTLDQLQRERALIDLTDACVYCNDPRARRYFTELVALSNGYVNNYPVRLTSILINEGRFDDALLELDAAQFRLTSARDCDDKQFEFYNLRLAMVHNARALLLQAYDRVDEALEQSTIAIELGGSSVASLIPYYSTRLELLYFGRRWEEGLRAAGVIQELVQRLDLGAECGEIEALVLLMQFRVGQIEDWQLESRLSGMTRLTKVAVVVQSFALGVLYFERGEFARARPLLEFSAGTHEVMFRLGSLLMLEASGVRLEAADRAWVRAVPAAVGSLTYFTDNAAQSVRPSELKLSVFGRRLGASIDGIALKLEPKNIWILAYIAVYKTITVEEIIELLYPDGSVVNPRSAVTQQTTVINRKVNQVALQNVLQKVGQNLEPLVAISCEADRLDEFDLDGLLTLDRAFAGLTPETEFQTRLAGRLNARVVLALESIVHRDTTSAGDKLRCYERMVALQPYCDFLEGDEPHRQFIELLLAQLVRSGRRDEARARAVIWQDQCEYFALPPLEPVTLERLGIRL